MDMKFRIRIRIRMIIIPDTYTDIKLFQIRIILVPRWVLF